jgi:CRISPR-associated protein Csx16
VVVLATEEADGDHGDGLKEALRAGNFQHLRFVRIPKGETPQERWTQFDTVKAQLRESTGPIMLDITHGFRSTPFFAAAVAGFVRAVDENPPELRVCYAALEARDAAGVAPIWELSEFVALLNWTSALMVFLRTGRAGLAAGEAERMGRQIRQAWYTAGRPGAEPRLKELGESLRQFGNDLETLRTGDLLIGHGGKGSSSERLLSAVKAASNDVAVHTPALADVLDRVAELLRPLAGTRTDLTGVNGKAAVAALANTYLSLGRHLEAAATVREGWINRYAGRLALIPGAADFDKQERDRAEEQANAQDPVFSGVQDRRNDLLHAQYRRQDAAQSADRIIGSVRE